MSRVVHSDSGGQDERGYRSFQGHDKMAILAGRAARFGAFAVLASAALLLSVAVPEAIAMEEEPLIRSDEQASGGFGDMSEGTRPVMEVEPSASVPTGFVPQQSGFKGFRYLFSRGKRTQDEGTATSPSEFDELDGQKKKGFLNFFRRGKKRGADREADQETEPKKRFWSRLNPRNWFGNKEPESTGVELTGKCRLRPMTAEDKLGIELPTPQYIVGNIQNGIKQGKKNLPSRFRPKARKLARYRQVCKPGTVLEELQGLIEKGIPGLSQNQDVRNAIGTLLEAVQRRTISWFSCFKVKVEHRKAECRREEETYTELVAKLPLCSRDVWNICHNIQAALDASPVVPVEPFPAGFGGKGSDLSLGNEDDG